MRVASLMKYCLEVSLSSGTVNSDGVCLRMDSTRVFVEEGGARVNDLLSLQTSEMSGGFRL
jgi:hypothetical protein